MPLHFCFTFFLFLPLLLVQGISLAQRPSKDVDALRRRSCSLSAGRSCGGPGTRARFSATIPFRFSGFGPLFRPLPVFGPRSRPAPFLTVLAAFWMFRPGRAAASWAAHVNHLHLSRAYTKLQCLLTDLWTVSRAAPTRFSSNSIFTTTDQFQWFYFVEISTWTACYFALLTRYEQRWRIVAFVISRHALRFSAVSVCLRKSPINLIHALEIYLSR